MYLSGYIVSATVTPIGVKFCLMVDIGPRHILDYPKRPQNPKFFAVNISKTVNRSATCQMGRNIGSTRAFVYSADRRRLSYVLKGAVDIVYRVSIVVADVV